MKNYLLNVFTLAVAVISFPILAQNSDPLPSWNDGQTKQAIIQFVSDVTDANSPNFVAPQDRIATFDNDGTLWSEKPMYFQILFMLDQIKEQAASHPDWKTTKPYSLVLSGQIDKLSLEDVLTMVQKTHSGMSSDEFTSIVQAWISTAKHPVTGRPYTDMVYQPMLELLDYLDSNGFKNFIVSGGGNAFMRAWATDVYNIPSERIIGTRLSTEFANVDGSYQVKRVPGIEVNNDKAEKPQQIYQHIGKRPIASFGNSDGDLQMLQWTTSGPGPRLAMYVHHTDDQREWKYDRTSSIGKLDKGLDEAKAKGWLIADMKNDWKQVYPTK
ncbi:haloacid dehalogenase-like hydrolase [Vibrio parahaemolyticus]|nr:haloacid dehalogenase-like hydrolase [Vibrio parahaemolyticus]EGR3034414.1 haloacid dehalogenase-like hydrolase [Vibrio parahaemolyticus]EIE1186916.1 haloacid dehalogenase-like hydrolase [Vibrio parahaemolyticus]EIE1188729.1 haloacid dehalogenase-like hydrolase [Vibrio parahaemolyticus]EJC6997241.1 haloacid dehalogenase-like hydrolase [Vibrio parahaemolyticus]